MFKGKYKIVIGLILMNLINMGNIAIAGGLANIAAMYPDLPITTIKLILSLPPLLTCVGTLLADPISKVISKKITGLIGIAIAVVFGVLPFFIPGFTALLVTRLIFGFGLGLLTPLPQAILFEQFRDEPTARNSLYGWTDCSRTIGSVLMSTIAGILVGVATNNIYLVYLFGIISFLGVLIFLPFDKPVKKDAAEAAQKVELSKEEKGKLSGLAIYMVLVTFVVMIIMNVFTLDGSLLVAEAGIGGDNSALVSSTGQSIMQVTSFLVALLIAFIYKGIKKWAMPVGIACMALGCLCMSVASSSILVWIAFGVYGIGKPLVFASAMTYAVKTSGKGVNGIIVSLCNVALALGQFVATYVHSGLASIFGVETCAGQFTISAIVMGIGLILSIILTFKRDSAPLIAGKAAK